MEEPKIMENTAPRLHRKPGKIALIRQKFRHGLVLFSIRNILASYGLDFGPYYWVQEGTSDIDPPKIKDDESKYTLRSLGVHEIGVMETISGVELDKLKKGLLEGRMQCIGLLCEEKVAALMFIEFGTIENRKRKFVLKDNEAYLSNMYTFHAFRGKNLAPYLRYKSYVLLRERGIDTFYSITACWNKSSHRFKKKLGAQPKELLLSIVWFKKWYWNFKF